MPAARAVVTIAGLSEARSSDSGVYVRQLTNMVIIAIAYGWL